MKKQNKEQSEKVSLEERSLISDQRKVREQVKGVRLTRWE